MPKSKNKKASSGSVDTSTDDVDAKNKAADAQKADKVDTNSKSPSTKEETDKNGGSSAEKAKKDDGKPESTENAADVKADDDKKDNDSVDKEKDSDNEKHSANGTDDVKTTDTKVNPSPKTDTSCAQKSDADARDGDNKSSDAKSDNEASKDNTKQPQHQKSTANSSNKQSTNDTSNSNNNPSRTPSDTTANNKPNATSSSGPTANTSNHQQQQQPPPAMQAPSSTTNVATNVNSNTALVDFDNDYNSDSKDTLLTMTFNQDGGCLAVGTGSGFRICNVNPFQETFRRSLGGGGAGGMDGGAGIAHIEMLYRTNLLALTGHTSSPQYPPNKVLIYDDHLQRTIGELSFRQKVLMTKLRRDRIVVVLRDRVYIYNFSDLALLDKVHTGDNPLGLVGISMDNGGVGGRTTSTSTGVERAEDALGQQTSRENNGLVLACPSTQRGQVRVELYGLRRTTFVDAHESALGALALSVDGSLLATASERGTVIRLFDTRGVTIRGGGAAATKPQTNTASVSSSVPLREFRRGVERATISCLTFSLDSNWLGCASNHGTVHIFQSQDPNNNSNNSSSASAAAAAEKKRSSSMTGKAMRMLPKLVTAPKKYLMDGEHSYAQVRGVPIPHACAFVPDREQTIAVAGKDEYGNGCLLLAEFGRPSSNTGGLAGGESKMIDDSEARRLGYHRFFKCKSPASQTGRRRTKSKDSKYADDAVVEGGAYIDDTPVDMRMNHISIGDENEDDFVPIDLEA